MLYTNLNHIEFTSQLENIIDNNTNVVFCYGKMDYDCVSVFNALELLENEFPNIKIFDIEYDNPEFEDFKQSISDLKLTKLPFVILFKNGKVKEAYTGTKNENQLRNIFNTVYTKLELAI